VVNVASPAAPLLVLARNVSTPAVLAALPVVNTIPLSIPSGVAVDTKRPLASEGHVSTGDEIVMPGPASFDASTDAVWLGVTASWQNADDAGRQNNREKRAFVSFIKPALI
jgi:uncharacterized protein YggE